MLVIYKNNIFRCKELNDGTIKIWKYLQFDGYESKTDCDNGVFSYSKTISLNDIDAMFSVDFTGEYFEKEFVLADYNGETVIIENGDIDFAEEHGFVRELSGVPYEPYTWLKKVPIKEFTELRIKFRYHYPEKKSDTLLIYRSQFDQYWKRYIDDFIPN